MELKNSTLGLSAFGLAAFSAIAMFAVVVIAAVMESTTPGGMDENSASAVMVGLAMFFFIFLDLIAVVLGVIDVFQADRKKLFSTLAIIIAGLTILGIIGLILLGLTMG
jgi:hypothetical protein